MRSWIALLFLLVIPNLSSAADVAAGGPTDLSVTIYRAPARGAGGISLEALRGFALVTETRQVSLPAGLSRLRFEGVADGIEAATAIVTGLPSGVIEKNRDAHLLSPASLVAAAVGKEVVLVRTDGKSGRTREVRGTIRSDAGGGVVFETEDGVEALRCSGLPETFSFDRGLDGFPARPTLSVLTRSERPIKAMVTLAYLARNFDWAADYVATLSPDGRRIDLGAWGTLANGNGTGFPDSRTQVVAGRLNRENGIVEPFDIGAKILAQCWPRGSTSDAPQALEIAQAVPMGGRLREDMMLQRVLAPVAAMMSNSVVQEEQLGDLKLYRVPNRTTVASRQSKQVRLLDRQGIPVERFYAIDVPASIERGYTPAEIRLRTRNDATHHLGLPLPSGQVAVFEAAAAGKLLVGQAPLKDTSLDEEIDLPLGQSPDVQVRQILEKRTIAAGDETKLIPLLPGVVLVEPAKLTLPTRVEIANARPEPIVLEVKLGLDPALQVARADHPMVMKDGRPFFRIEVPANGNAVLRYQTAPR